MTFLELYQALQKQRQEKMTFSLQKLLSESDRSALQTRPKQKKALLEKYINRIKHYTELFELDNLVKVLSGDMIREEFEKIKSDEQYQTWSKSNKGEITSDTLDGMKHSLIGFLIAHSFYSQDVEKTLAEPSYGNKMPTSFSLYLKLRRYFQILIILRYLLVDDNAKRHWEIFIKLINILESAYEDRTYDKKNLWLNKLQASIKNMYQITEQPVNEPLHQIATLITENNRLVQIDDNNSLCDQIAKLDKKIVSLEGSIGLYSSPTDKANILKLIMRDTIFLANLLYVRNLFTNMKKLEAKITTLIKQSINTLFDRRVYYKDKLIISFAQLSNEETYSKTYQLLLELRMVIEETIATLYKLKATEFYAWLNAE